MPRSAAGADEALILQVQLNARDTGKLAEFILRDSALFARPEDLRDLGLRVPDEVRPAPDGLIALSELPGAAWRVDQPSQTVFITAADAALTPQVLQPVDRLNGRTVESGTGVTLNYDVTAAETGGDTVGSSLLDLRVFSPHGVASTGFLAFARAGSSAPAGASLVRLDTTYTVSDPTRLRRYRVGDFISGGLSWTRSVRLGGVQVTSDFSLRPDLVTFPLPSLNGSAAVPSTLEVLANGSQLLSRDVEPGPFQIPRLPVVSGAGDISMTLTNALGRQVVATMPFYANPALLTQGLQTFSAQVGAVRRNWSVLSDDYGAVAAAASYRRGLTNTVTFEATGEAIAGNLMTGAGIVATIKNWIVLNTAVAGSVGSGRGGALVSFGIKRSDAQFSFAASVTASSRGFRDIAAVTGDPVPRLQVSASVSRSLGAASSLSLAYVGIDQDVHTPQLQPRLPANGLIQGVAVASLPYLAPAIRTRIVTGSYSAQVGRASLSATGFRDFAGRSAIGLVVSLTIPFGGRSSVSASAGTGSGESYGQIQAERSATFVGDWGYQAYGLVGTDPHEFGQLQYHAPWALITAGADRFAGRTSLRAEAQGSVSALDGAVFAANTIDDSFAVVDTNGLAGVHVLSENLPVGVTNSAGRLLAPGLRAFDVNRIAIEPTDVPADIAIDTTTREVRPQDRSGVVVRFQTEVSHGALLRLVDVAGAPLPLGSTATLGGTVAAAPVGYDGAVYLQDLRPHNALVVNRPDGRRCSLTFDYQPLPGDIPTIGPLACLDAPP